MPDPYPQLGRGAPRMIVEAAKLLDVRETIGARDNPLIMAWARETGVSGYWADSVPWCGLFMAVVAMRAAKPLPARPLWALDWARWGTPADRPALGDVLVFRRPSGGHIGLYVAEDATAFHVLGGNQGDRVCILRIARTRLHAARRPAYTVRPASVRPYAAAASRQPLSANEA